MSLFNRLFSKCSDQQSGSKQINPSDWVKETFLMNEAKFRHQQPTVKRASKDDQINLGYILKEILNIDPADIGAMTIVSRGGFDTESKTETVVNPSDVLAYKPFDTILTYAPEDEVQTRQGMNTVLVIAFRPTDRLFSQLADRKDKSKLRYDNSIIMFLRGLGPFATESVYMRVSVMIPNFSSPDDFRTSRSRNTPFTTSFILAYDRVPPEKRLKEYDRVKRSLDKAIDADRDLTNEEAAVLEGITGSKDLAYDFGYGRWLVSQNRFTDALFSLMKAYNWLKTAVVKDNNPQVHEAFVETCYNIGYCYNEMEQFDRAAYYLELTQGNSANVRYVMEYINALVNSNDPRSMNIVIQQLHELDEGKWKDAPEGEMFRHYLFRRLAYLYIEYEKWDKARELLEQMKDSPEDRDFALGELEYLRQLGKA